MSAIAAYFDELDLEIARLLKLETAGYDDEAFTLCLVYIDRLAQRLLWPSDRSGANFVQALSAFGNDVQLALVHPLQLIRDLRSRKDSWQKVADAVEQAFPGPSYELQKFGDVEAAVQTALTSQQLSDLRKDLWRGSMAAVAYYRLRNPAIHGLGVSSSISFDGTMWNGQRAAPLDFARLHAALGHLAAEARRRSETTGQWFGDDRTVA